MNFMRMLEHIRKQNPLVHCMTNVVVTNFTANGLLALGASPVMAYAKEEVATMAQVAKALLLNIGTLSTEQIEQMIIAGKAANKAGVPVVLDPVGAGATPYRTKMSLRILEEVDVTVLRGNAGEIASLIGVKAEVKGVDGALEGDFTTVAKEAANRFRCVAVVTGKTDVISDGERLYLNEYGHEEMTRVVGSGCLLGAVVAAFLTVRKDEPFEAAAEAVTYFGIAGERAYQLARKAGIGTFQEMFLNELDRITDETISDWRKLP